MDERRQALADRAAELYAEGGRTYSEAIDEAMTESGMDAGAALRELLNVVEPVEHPTRVSPRAPENDRGDEGIELRRADPSIPEGEPAPDGDDTFGMQIDPLPDKQGVDLIRRNQ